MKATASRIRMTAATAGCALLAAAGGAGVSFAWFASSAASEGNSAAAGTLVLDSDASVFDIAAPGPYKTVRPGGPDASGVQTIANHGSVGGDLTVYVSDIDQLSAQNLAPVLRLSIDECTTGSGSTCGDPVSRHEGLLTAATSPIALGALAPQGSAGDTKRFRIRVSWPRAADDVTLHDDQTGFQLNWNIKTSA